MTSVIADPVDALVTWATANVSYTDDDSKVQTVASNGLEVLTWLDAEKTQAGIPRIVVGPISNTPSRPFNIGASPELRWDYQHMVELHLETMRCASPNVSGYNAKIALTEAIEDALIAHLSDIDGTGAWLTTMLTAGPRDNIADSDPANDRFHVVFIINVRRTKVR